MFREVLGAQKNGVESIKFPHTPCSHTYTASPTIDTPHQMAHV